MDAVIFLSLAAVALIAALAFFTAAATALNAAPRSLMHQLERQGDSRALLVNKLRLNKERLFAGLLVGKGVTAIGATALMTGVFVHFLGLYGIAYGAGVMIMLLLTFAEILPRTIALQHPAETALALVRPAKVCVDILSPLTALLRWLVTLILRRATKAEDARATLLSPIQTLRGAIDVHAEEAGEIQQQRAMLHSILELDEVEVSEIMIHRQDVVMIDIDAPIADIREQIARSRYTRIPLWRDKPENIIGILHTKALLQQLRSNRPLEKSDILAVATPPWFVPDTRTLIDQLQAFRRRRKHFAVVVDEYGVFMGIVTLEDILEEIVGDIADEHDVTTPGVSLAPDGTVVVEGTATIRDLNRRFDWSLPDEEAATVAGLILHESRQIPEVGLTFVFHDFRFEILQRKRNQITLIKIAPPVKRQDLETARERPVGKPHAA
jgi:Mg2+/Co2+ transporter CorB